MFLPKPGLNIEVRVKHVERGAIKINEKYSKKAAGSKAIPCICGSGIEGKEASFTHSRTCQVCFTGSHQFFEDLPILVIACVQGSGYSPVKSSLFSAL